MLTHIYNLRFKKKLTKKRLRQRNTGRFLNLTVRFPWLFAQAAGDVALEFTQCGRFERLEVDLDLLGVGVAQRGLAGLDDVHDAAQLVTRQLVDVEAELPLGVVAHRETVLFLLGVVLRNRRSWRREACGGC